MLKFAVLCWVGLWTSASLHAQAVEVRKLVATEQENYQYMGWSTSLSGDRALIGAPYDRDLGLTAGAAYVFERDAGGSWREVAKMHASDGGEGHYFGVG